MAQTQMQAARAGQITEAMEQVAKYEGMDPEKLRILVGEGKVAIPKNPAHKNLEPRGVGEGLSVKVNANIGTSSDRADAAEEIDKLNAALEAGADAVMDLSTGGDLRAMRQQVLDNCPVPVGTVPIYQAAVEVTSQDRGIVDMTADELFGVIEDQAKQGVDFITVHCGVNMAVLDRLRGEGRIMDIVSRGGSFMACWILANEKENPLYEHYDRLLEICRAHDVTLSLGDGLRPGCLADATDRAQITELITLGELTQRAWDADVQVMIEGPGHVPLNQIQTNIQLQKRLCHNAPFYVLGPLVTDIAAGHDHVACAIGGALAGAAGADFLCYVTPTEHLALPGPEDVYRGVVVTRVAAHAADIAKGREQSIAKDNAMAKARADMDWETMLNLCLDPRTARKIRENSLPAEEEVCTMCGRFCAVRLMRDYFHPERKKG
ncbi:phosphomethylpyrimidine synthase ThiC [Dethiosulfatarculus sandiegensis]|uniref:Phosphomethylpyrimidine synthase n=1 Tax=Dethiosulfatarculus sandiegensis TaxID=1429043 RepID=A0A0D2JN54_9BACT|nr:phosphomethylpyrimidine synthase ThiC [Dethiosulfatarculus sandiegensis]KIX10920.1 phosphomethylpyrimidine synthase [Dethiosulfatarculus sandiegensis]